MVNLNNYGSITGRVTREPAINENSDGSRKFRFTVASLNNYKSKNGTRESQFVELEAFVSANANKTAFDFINKGDLVSFGYTVRTNNYTDSNNVKHYGQVLLIQDVELRETKKSKEARNTSAPAQASTPAVSSNVPPEPPADVTADEIPFGE